MWFYVQSPLLKDSKFMLDIVCFYNEKAVSKTYVILTFTV